MLHEGKPSFSSYLEPLQEDREVCLMIDALLLGLGGVKGRNCNALFGSLLYSLMRDAVSYPSGGTRRIYETLRESFLENGGELRSTWENPRLIRAGKKIKGLATVERDELLGRILLGDFSLWQIYEGEEGQRRRRRHSKRPPLNEALTLFLGVDQEVLSEEMAENLLLVPDSAATSPDWSPIWIRTGASGGEGQAPPGKRALAASALLFTSGLSGGAEQEARAKQMLRELENFLPFLSQHLHFEQVHLRRSFSMLQPGRGWGLKLRIAPLKQMGYPGLRVFSPERNLLFIGDLPIYGIGLRAQIDSGYYWANLLGPLKSREG
jgi:phytoene dehydrogenase-like protein